jgi:hypothetical protein
VTGEERDELVKAIARRVVELLEPTLGARGRPRGEELVNAAKLAELLGVSRDYVYDHAEELGAIRLSGRDRARLRFHPDTAQSSACRCLPAPAPVEQRPSTRATHASTPRQ